MNGRFEILREHGKGSLGDTLYIGKHPDLEKEVIIRILPPEMKSSTDTVQRFIQSVRLTAALKHQNILPAYDAGEDNGIMYFVSASETGLYLADYIKMKGKLEQEESIKIIMAVADALKYAWEEKKVLHRNICPSTILVASGVHPMLTDFGLAKSFEPGKDSLTVTGFTVGNPQYMSPEQAMGERELTFHADMYCLGLVFYEMLAGQPAFQDKSQVMLMDAQMNKTPKLLSEYNSKISADCIAIIDKMTAKDKGKRYETWDMLIKDLKAVLAGKPIASMAGKKLVMSKDPSPKTAYKPAASAPRIQQPKPTSMVPGLIITVVVLVVIIIVAILILKNAGK